ncbi:hypothetical protein C8J57DRAFT_1718708 [Mycena rebaudengoi]|nr:hypothetical protein C8J57DRAFT_1718708 [Mycena rebaudengoi]
MATAPENVHPSFADKAADIVLQSTEGTIYRVHSFTLRNTSRFFNSLLSLPQPTGSPTQQEIPVGEPDAVMERLLRIMCGLEIPRWTSFEEVEAALDLIEKWDAPGPLSVVRTAITSPLFAEAEPLRVYVLASHFGWAEETRDMMKSTLRLSILDGTHDDMLCQLSSKSLLTLLAFHDRCKARFKEALDGTLLFSAGNEEPRECACGKIRDNYPWRVLKAKLIAEFNQRPLGDRVLVDMAGWIESAECWRAKCHCGHQYYDQVSTVTNIKQSIVNATELPVV